MATEPTPTRPLPAHVTVDGNPCAPGADVAAVSAFLSTLDVKSLRALAVKLRRDPTAETAVRYPDRDVVALLVRCSPVLASLSGGWIATANKADLVAAILGDPVSAPRGAAAGSDPAEVVAGGLLALLGRQLADLVDERLARLAPRTLRIETPPAPPRDVPGPTHERFPLLVQLLAQRQHVALVGPAGTGKTSAAVAAAEALGLPFRGMQSWSPQTTAFHLWGGRGANGQPIRAPWREAYEHGGIFLFDEVDTASSGILKSLNSALSNGVATWPDDGQTVRIHPDCRIVATANSWGRGRDADYSAAQQQDAAVLDRFFALYWGYDMALERQLAGPEGAAWCAWCHRVRAALDSLGGAVRLVVSMRAIAAGPRLLAAGVPRAEVEAGLVWRGLPAAQRDKVLAAMPREEAPKP